MEKKVLQPLYELFCREYVVDFNAARAARACGKSRENSANAGHKLLQRADVMERIGELLRDRYSGTEKEAIDVQREIERIAFSDRRNVVDEDGNLLMPHELNADIGASIDGFEISSKGVKYKFSQKHNALRMLAERYDMFAKHERNKAANVVVNITGPDAAL